jgi:hypothetical protein
MHYLHLITIFFFIHIINTQNATDCVAMYYNNTITVPCITNSTCCYYGYSFNGQSFQSCQLKLNSTDNVCDTVGQGITYFYGSLDNCDCFSEIIKFTKHLSIFILLILL